MPLSISPALLTRGSRVVLLLSGLTPGKPYRVSILPVREKDSHYDTHSTADVNGAILWQQEINWSGEALCDIFYDEHPQAFETLHVYAAAPEIASRRPLRCDFHIHTTYSDGKDTLEQMLVRGRSLGLDALAITDHNQYQGNREAVDLLRRAGSGLVYVMGEEVTSWTWHMLSLGASGPVGFTSELEGYQGMRRTIDRIHALGGHAFLAHPYWTSRRRTNQPVEEYERLLAEGGIDGIELFGEVLWEENLRSLARYAEIPATQKPPILGNSDTHAMEHTFGSYNSIVFAEELTPQSILDAVSQHLSVACMWMQAAPASHPIRRRMLAGGPFELVDLSIFLEQNYFPEHDRLCQREAALMRQALSGDSLPPGAMETLHVEMDTNFRSFWGWPMGEIP
jgi:hypothetical protein